MPHTPAQHPIPGIAKLNLTDEQVSLITERAALQRRFANVTFKVVQVTDTSAVILVRQGKSHAGNYFDTKRLIEILRETFADQLGTLKLEARPYIYEPSPVDVVTPQWLQQQRGERTIKQIAADLNVDANTISAYIGGLKPLSGVVKAMFYYYFTKAMIQKYWIVIHNGIEYPDTKSAKSITAMRRFMRLHRPHLPQTHAQFLNTGASVVCRMEPQHIKI